MTDKSRAFTTVSAAEVIRNFGEWQSRAMLAPIAITHHGRARLMLQSIEDFESRGDAGAVDQSLSEARITGQVRHLLNQMHEGFFAFDEALKMTDVNSVGELYLGLARDDLIGRDLRDLLPATRNSIAWDYYRRVLKSAEPLEFKLRSNLRVGSILTMRAFPYNGGVGVLFDNVTSVDAALAEQTWWRTLQTALQADPSMAIIRLNVRGGLDAVDDNFCRMTGFSADQLTTLLLTEIVHPRERLPVARAVNDIIRERTPKSINATLMTRGGDERRLRLTMSASPDEPVSEGVVVCVTDLDARQPADPSKGAAG